MPYSVNDGKEQIKGLVNELCGKRMLDVGCGYGAYGRMVEGKCFKVGVDAVNYRRRFKLGEVYNNFIVHDIRDTDFLRRLGSYDLAVAGDVLEHMSVQDARRVLSTLEQIAEAVIVAVPYTWKQKDWNGNTWEDHIQDDLTPELVTERYPELRLIAMYNSNDEPWNGRPYYGYYLWRKEKA